MKKRYFSMNQRLSKLAVAIVALFATQTLSAVEYFQRLAMEGVEIMGAITYGKADAFTYMQPGFYSFDFDNQFSPDRTKPLFVASPMGGCVYHDGKIYSNEFPEQSQYVKPMWRVYDAKTFKLLSEHELPDNCACTTTNLAYDPTTDYIYGFNETYTETYVVRIDPNTGEMVRLGDFQDRNMKFLTIACSPDGNLYCTYLNKMTDAIYLGKIRKSTGQVAMIRGISATNLLPGDSFINSAYDQSMFFNNVTGKMYWMFQSSSMMLYRAINVIYEVDPLTASAVMVAYIDAEFQGPGAFFIEPAMKAPAVISDFDWTPDEEGSRSGTLALTVPTTAYDGTALDGQLTLTISSEEISPITALVTPGDDYSIHLDNVKEGWVNLNIAVKNAAGEGPSVKRRFFSGYDTPKAPTNVTLTNSGLHTFLTWTAPTEGIYGKPIDAADLTYKVVRYPGEVTVADNLKQCIFEEDHPEEMTRYVYQVSAKSKGKESKMGMSNNLIVGTPLDIPYGGEFKFIGDLYNYYTILDCNNDNYTWMYDSESRCAVYHYNMEEPADDWLIAPPLNYKAGKTYELAFKAYSSSSSYRESLEVLWGIDKSPETLNNMLLEVQELPAYNEETNPEEYKVQFSVPADGVYYYGFHAVSQKFREYLYIGNVRIYEYGTSSISNPDVDNLKINTSKGMLSVSLDSDSDVSVYDLTGRMVAKSRGKSVTLPLRSGTYVVSANGKTVKAIVK